MTQDVLVSARLLPESSRITARDVHGDSGSGC